MNIMQDLLTVGNGIDLVNTWKKKSVFPLYTKRNAFGTDLFKRRVSKPFGTGPLGRRGVEVAFQNSWSSSEPSVRALSRTAMRSARLDENPALAGGIEDDFY